MNLIRCFLTGLTALLLCFPVATLAGIPLDIETELRLLEQKGRTHQRYISAARFRAATFTYEDPDNTRWGEDIGRLMGHEILMNSGVYSLGVLKYEGQLAPREKGGLSYFDKVEKLAEAQGVTLAVWGVIRRIKDTFRIDTFAQISPNALDRYLRWEVQLPKAMGGGTLQAHLRPNRIRVQSLTLNAGAINDVLQAAQSLKTLRDAPRADARVVGELPQSQIHYVLRREGDWALLQVRNGPKGWIPVKDYCLGGCKLLMEAARFTGGLLRYMASRKAHNATDHLTTEALAVEEQIKALDGLNRPSASAIATQSLARAERWVGPNRWIGKDKWTQIDRGNGTAPGGAAFANVHSLAKLAMALQEAYEQRQTVLAPRLEHVKQRLQHEHGRGWTRYVPPEFLPEAIFDDVSLDKDTVRDIAFDLANASQYDPRNTDVLSNLAVLFEYLGDTKRSQLARALTEKYTHVD